MSLLVCLTYHRQRYFGFFTLLEHTETLPRLEGKAQRRVLAKTRRLMQDAPGQPAGGSAGGQARPAGAPAAGDAPPPAAYV